MRIMTLECGVGPTAIASKPFISITFLNECTTESNVNGLSFTLPYIQTYAQAAKLAHEMEECIKILDRFIEDGPSIDLEG